MSCSLRYLAPLWLTFSVAHCGDSGCPPGSTLTAEGRCVESDGGTESDAGADGGVDSGSDAALLDGCAGCADSAPAELEIVAPRGVRVVRGSSTSFTITVTTPEVEEHSVEVLGLPDGVTADVTAGSESEESEVVLRASTVASEGGTNPTLRILADGFDTLSVSLALFVAGLPGSPDTSFNLDGAVTVIATDGPDVPRSVSFDGVGNLVVGGERQGPEPAQGWLVRLQAEGTLDRDFGTDGVVRGLGMSDHAGSTGGTAHILDDGRILVSNRSFGDAPTVDHFTVRGADGALDTAFGAGGFLSLDEQPHSVRARGTGTYLFRSGGAVSELDPTTETVTELATRPDGVPFQFLEVGLAGLPVITGSNFVTPEYVLARFNSDGGLDTTFGLDGIVRVAGGEGEDHEVQSVQPLPDGTYLVLAQARQGLFDEQIPVLFRLLHSGELDGSFGTAGVANVLESRLERANATSMIALSDGSSLVQVGSETYYVTRRYRADGSRDMEFGTDGVLEQTGLMVIDPEPLARRVVFARSESGVVVVRRFWL